MTDNSVGKSDKKVIEEIVESDLATAVVCFPKISFSAVKDSIPSDSISTDRINCIREVGLNVSVNWMLKGIRKDNKGVIIGSSFKMTGNFIDINLIAQVKMEFKKQFLEQQIFNTTFFQVLAAKILFPYLAELVAVNTHKLEFAVSPLLLDERLLRIILDDTVKRGVFQKVAKNNINSNQ